MTPWFLTSLFHGRRANRHLGGLSPKSMPAADATVSYTSFRRSRHTQSMLAHYLWKFRVYICDKLQASCLMKRNISCHTVRHTMLLSTLQKSYSKYPPFVRTRALRRLRHPSIASSSRVWRNPKFSGQGIQYLPNTSAYRSWNPSYAISSFKSANTSTTASAAKRL